MARYESGAQFPKSSVIKKLRSVAGQYKLADLRQTFEESLERRVESSDQKAGPSASDYRVFISHIPQALEQSSKLAVSALSELVKLEPKTLGNEAATQAIANEILFFIALELEVLNELRNQLMHTFLLPDERDWTKLKRGRLSSSKKWIDYYRLLKRDFLDKDKKS